MEKFGLQLEESKSRLLQSGAYIARAKKKSGESTRLETFDFLGFTFYCGRSRKGMPYIMPKTSSKKFRQKIRDIKVWLYANRDQSLKKLMGMLNLKLVGHYRYYGISFNVSDFLSEFLRATQEKDSLKCRNTINWHCQRYMSACFDTVNIIMKSRMRESRTYGSVRGLHCEV